MLLLSLLVISSIKGVLVIGVRSQSGVGQNADAKTRAVADAFDRPAIQNGVNGRCDDAGSSCGVGGGTIK